MVIFANSLDPDQTSINSVLDKINDTASDPDTNLGFSIKIHSLKTNEILAAD